MVDMKTATAERGHATETDRIISRTVRGILAFTAMPADHFWNALGISRTTYYNKVNGDSPWTASEVRHAADVLGVAVADLYDGRIPQALPMWAPRGSNPQPTGFSVQLDLFGEDVEDSPPTWAGFPFPSSRRPLMAVAA